MSEQCESSVGNSVHSHFPLTLGKRRMSLPSILLNPSMGKKCKLLYMKIVSLTLGFLFPLFLWAQLTDFNTQTPPPAPDYSLEKNWSALPNRVDAPDVIPKDETWIPDDEKQVDVFYIHPTMYQKGKAWNASLQDEKMNKQVDKKPVRLQASTFNRSCRVYAPRYRQAILQVFYEDTENSKSALDLAYEDVKTAFQYYLDNYNQGKPIIIASHSQGTCHSRRLLAEFFDGTKLQNKLVVAYTVGFGINEGMYKNLKLCRQPQQTGCFVGWMTYKEGFHPDGDFYKGHESVNPVTWTCEDGICDKSLSKGAVLLNVKRKYEHNVQVQIVEEDGGTILWAKNSMPVLRSMKSLHIADYNLFWYDIRENVAQRIGAFWK